MMVLLIVRRPNVDAKKTAEAFHCTCNRITCSILLTTATKSYCIQKAVLDVKLILHFNNVL